MVAELAPIWLTPINQFCDFLRYERNYAASTISLYNKSLQASAHYLTQHCEKWSQVQADHIRSYSMQLKRDGLGARSINLKLSCLRSFFKYLQQIQQAKPVANPAITIKGPKYSKPLPKNLDVDQMAQLLDIPTDDALALRDKAMMELLYSSGLRISELVSINVGDINNGEVRVLGKGNKERIVPVGRVALNAIKAWLKVRPQFVSGDENALFLSNKKLRISSRQVRLRMREWGIKQGISAKVHPHKLRHSFASHILESSGDLRAVQELLGHANLSTTQVYTHLDFQHLAKVYDNTHPRAKKQK